MTGLDSDVVKFLELNDIEKLFQETLKFVEITPKEFKKMNTDGEDLNYICQVAGEFHMRQCLPQFHRN